MAGTSFTLELKDKFTNVFENFIHKHERLEKLIRRQEYSIETIQRITERTYGRMTSEFDGALGELDRMQQTLVRLTQAFGQNSDFVQAYAADISGAIGGMGGQWTDAAAGMDRATLLLNNSLIELREAGLVDLGDEANNTIQQMLDFADTEEEVAEKAEKVEKKLGDSGGGLSRTLRRVGVQLFGIHKIVTMVKHAFERAPDAIANKWKALKSSALDTVARLSVSMLRGMQKGMERLNKAFQNPAVVRLIKMLQILFELIGTVIGFAAEKVAEFAEFLANQITNSGIQFGDLFEYLGTLFGILYVTAHNIFAAIWNTVATFAEFFANVFNDPVGSIVKLFVGMANTVLDIIKVITRAIDKVFNKGWTAEIESLQSRMTNWAEEKYGDSGVKFDRMETISYDQVNQFAAAGRSFGERMEAANIDREKLQAIKSIDSNTGAIKDAITDEDLKMLIDVATQKFVSNVNLTAQTPVITINGANTGNTEADRRALANTIRDILVEQVASGSTSGYYSYQEA